MIESIPTQHGKAIAMPTNSAAPYTVSLAAIELGITRHTYGYRAQSDAYLRDAYRRIHGLMAVEFNVVDGAIRLAAIERVVCERWPIRPCDVAGEFLGC